MRYLVPYHRSFSVLCNPDVHNSTRIFAGLKKLSVSALNELYEELEITIKDYSETLIAELALRDELEYEKELKNQFISLLLSIQKKRRETQIDKKRNHKKMRGTNGTEPGTVSEARIVPGFWVGNQI